MEQHKHGQGHEPGKHKQLKTPPVRPRKTRTKTQNKRKQTSPDVVSRVDDKKVRLSELETDFERETDTESNSSTDPCSVTSESSDTESFQTGTSMNNNSQSDVTLQASQFPAHQSTQGDVSLQGAQIDQTTLPTHHSSQSDISLQGSQIHVNQNAFTPQLNASTPIFTHTVPNFGRIGAEMSPFNLHTQFPNNMQQMPYVPLPEAEIERIAQKMKDFLCIEIERAVETKVQEVISDLKAEFGNVVQKLVDEKTDDLNEKVKKLKYENDRLVHENYTLSMKVDDLEQYSRRNCIRISNCKEPSNNDPKEDTDAIVLNVARKAGVSITDSDIDRSHRIGKRNPRRPRDIIVKFSSYKARAVFIKGRKTLRNNKEQFFISEDLTKYRSELFYDCRMLAKNAQSDIEKAWTFDGKIFVQPRNSKFGYQIKSHQDLDPYRTR